MEIFILIAVLVTGASGLYMAYTFKNHIEKDVAPLIQRIAEDARKQIEAASKDLTQQIQASAGPLAAVASMDLATNGELRHQVWTMTDGLQRETRTITGELQRDREQADRRAERLSTRQDQIGKDLLQADHRIGQLSESLARQGAQLTAIYGYAMSQGKQAGTSP